MAPIIFALRDLTQGPKGEKKESLCFTGATVKTLQVAVKADRIFPDEVRKTTMKYFLFYCHDSIGGPRHL